MRASVAPGWFLWLVAAACSDYELKPIEDDVGGVDSGGVDTGEEPPPYDDSEDPCYEMTCVEPVSWVRLTTSDVTYCQFILWAGDTDVYSDGGSYESYGGWDSIRTIWVFGMDGDDGEGRPEGYSVLFVRYTELEGVDAELSTWAMAAEPLRWELSDLGVTADWWVGISGMDLGDVDRMWEDVRSGTGLHYTDIGWDVLRIAVDPEAVATDADCGVYLPLEVCVDHDPGDWEVWSPPHGDDEDWANAVPASRAVGDCGGEGDDRARADTGGAADVAEADAGVGRCVAGSGTFAPVPVPGMRDTLGALGLAPIHLAGTGALTADAWVTSWGVSEGASLERLVAPAGERWRRRRLFSPPTLSGAWPAEGSGEIWFRAPSADGGAVPYSAVDMTWDCPDTGPDKDGAGLVAPATSSRGYAFRLSDIGCPVDWPQRFRLRRAGDARDGRLWVDLEGRTASLPVGGPAGGRLRDEISIQEGGAVLRGNVMLEDETGVVIRLDEVSWHGMPLCQPGVFRLAADGW